MRKIYCDGLVGTISSDNTVMLFGEKCYALGAEKVTQVSKLRGASIKYCYGDEVADWSEEVFAMLKSRLDKDYSCFDGTYNPQYPGHWLKKFLDSDADIFSQIYTIDDNPFLSDSFKENLKREYAGTVHYERYILGKWVLAEGLVYNFTEGNITDDAPTDGEYYISVDYGTMNPFSAGLWCVSGSKAVRVREYYYGGRDKQVMKTDEEYCDEIEKLSAGLAVRLVIVDPSAASFIAALRKRGYKVKQADNTVSDGIRRVAVYLANGNIKIHRSCADCIREFGMYRWDESAGEDKVIKEYDHAMDEVRYFANTVMKNKIMQDAPRHRAYQ
jgi:PBSX family phage terminase large subunit